MAFKADSKLSSGDIWARLVDMAMQNKIAGLDYAGEISPREAFDYACENLSFVIDVRTSPEWQSVGVPDLSKTVSSLIALSWKLYPSFVLNSEFIGDLLANKSISKDTPLFFLCRSGGRSLDAAVAVATKGYKYCFNVTGGFEGNSEQRGWKNDNLPWVQI